VLVAGCGGGFDVFAGVPIPQHLMAAGKHITFANFSFTNLALCGGRQCIARRIRQLSRDQPNKRQ